MSNNFFSILIFIIIIICNGTTITTTTIKVPPRTASPTTTPSQTLSVKPTYQRVENNQCCETTDYNNNNNNQWKTCNSAGGETQVSDCSRCVSYQCIDWTIGSNFNKVREAAFKRKTFENVFFGVGSYGNDESRAGKLQQQQQQ